MIVIVHKGIWAETTSNVSIKNITSFNNPQAIPVHGTLPVNSMSKQIQLFDGKLLRLDADLPLVHIFYKDELPEHFWEDFYQWFGCHAEGELMDMALSHYLQEIGFGKRDETCSIWSANQIINFFGTKPAENEPLVCPTIPNESVFNRKVSIMVEYEPSSPRNAYFTDLNVGKEIKYYYWEQIVCSSGKIRWKISPLEPRLEMDLTLDNKGNISTIPPKLETWFKTVNEIRQDAGLQPVPGGDIFLNQQYGIPDNTKYVYFAAGSPIQVPPRSWEVFL